MRGQIYAVNVKEEAEQLRSQGKTYKEIREVLGIPKSTLSGWVGKKFPGIFNRAAQLAHLSRIQPLAVAAKKRGKEMQRDALRQKIQKEILSYPLNSVGFYKAILSGLYWAEGAKHEKVSGLIFANTDPRLAQFYITILRKCYVIDEKKFRIRLHLHYYHKIKECKKFWSELLNVPIKQFAAVHIKKRSRKKRFRKNFRGICFIKYLDSNIRKELMEIAYQLQEFSVKKFSKSS